MRRKKIGHIKISVGSIIVDVNGRRSQTSGFHVDTPILQGETVDDAIGRGLSAQHRAKPRRHPDEQGEKDDVL